MSKELAMNPPSEYVRMPHWMWILHAGFHLPCQWRSEEWPYACSDHVYGYHMRDGQRIAGYCKKHFPEGLMVVNQSIQWCAECDEQSYRMDYDGVMRCDTHRRMNPVNHLATEDALEDFTDQQLLEQAAWLEQKREELLAEPQDDKPYGNRYAAYRTTVTHSAISAEWKRRHDRPLGERTHA